MRPQSKKLPSIFTFSMHEITRYNQVPIEFLEPLAPRDVHLLIGPVR